jgi:hypothetical protein
MQGTEHRLQGGYLKICRTSQKPGAIPVLDRAKDVTSEGEHYPRLIGIDRYSRDLCLFL